MRPREQHGSLNNSWPLEPVTHNVTLPLHPPILRYVPLHPPLRRRATGVTESPAPSRAAERLIDGWPLVPVTTTVTHRCHARRYAHVTPTTTGGGRAYLLRRRAGRSGDADDAAPEKVATASPLPGRPRLVERVAHHTSPSQDATYVTPRLLHARPATESRALRYRPLAGDATHVTRTTGD